MNSRKTFLTVASAVLALSTALRAAAEPAPADAQTQAAAVLTARSQFHSAQLNPNSQAAIDAQGQARAVVRAEVSPSPTLSMGHNGGTPLKVLPETRWAHHAVDKKPDAQSMAATVLLGRGA